MPDELTVGVTGAGGYIGRALCDRLVADGFRVIELVRTPRRQGSVEYRLESPLDGSVLDGIDIVAHCAWDLSASSSTEIKRINIDGSVRLVREAAARNVHTVFISSMAAFDGCRSMYGAAKRVVEREVIGLGGVVVRPGTVYGGHGGGIVEQIVAVMERVHVAPLIGGGAQGLYVVEIDRLARSICQVVAHMTQFRGRILMAADPERRTLRSFVETLATTHRIRAVMLPLPAPLLYFPLRFLELIGVEPPLRSDSVVSIAHVMPPELVSGLERI